MITLAGYVHWRLTGKKVLGVGDAAGMFSIDSAKGTYDESMLQKLKPLQKYYTEIDMVTTPCGSPVAMVHCNNCTSNIAAWVNLFSEVIALYGVEKSAGELFPLLSIYILQWLR